MGTTAYAGILGPLALALVLRAAWSLGSGVEGTLLAAMRGPVRLCGDRLLSPGRLPTTSIGESVRTQFQSAMADWDRTARREDPAKTNHLMCRYVGRPRRRAAGQPGGTTLSR